MSIHSGSRIKDQGWVKAKDLVVGDELETSDGTHLSINKIEVKQEHHTVYKFRVKDFHTYYVSNLKVLTHNTECDIKGAGKGMNNSVVKEKAAKGRQMHKDYDYGPDVKKEKGLPSGKRMDGYNPNSKAIHELKPNNPRGINKGLKQLYGYIEEANKVYGPGHKGKLHIYD